MFYVFTLKNRKTTTTINRTKSLECCFYRKLWVLSVQFLGKSSSLLLSFSSHVFDTLYTQNSLSSSMTFHEYTISVCMCVCVCGLLPVHTCKAIYSVLFFVESQLLTQFRVYVHIIELFVADSIGILSLWPIWFGSFVTHFSMY